LAAAAQLSQKVAFTMLPGALEVSTQDSTSLDMTAEAFGSAATS
jgi:hypothetical protein